MPFRDHRSSIIVVLGASACATVLGQPGPAVGCGGEDLQTEWVFEAPIDPGAPNLLPRPNLLYVPSPEAVRAVVVFEEHVGGAGEYTSFDWRAAAADEGLALLQVELEPDNGRETAFDFPDQAAVQLESTLVFAAAESGHPELATVPVVLFGHSAGSQLMVLVAAQLPERTLGWVGYKGGIRAFDPEGIEDLGLLEPSFLGVPGLLVVAEHEPAGMQNAALALESVARQHGGLVALAIERGGNHITTGTSREITIPFVREVLEQRLSPMGSLEPLTENAGWSGHLTHRQEPDPSGGPPYVYVDSAAIAPYGTPSWEAEGATWLLSEDFANLWLDFATP